MRKLITDIIELVLLALYAIFPFLQVFHYVGVLQNGNGPGVIISNRSDRWFSALQNLIDLVDNTALGIVIIVGLELIYVLTAVFVVFDILKKNKMGNLFFAISTLLFVGLMITAGTVARGF